MEYQPKNKYLAVLLKEQKQVGAVDYDKKRRQLSISLDPKYKLDLNEPIKIVINQILQKGEFNANFHPETLTLQNSSDLLAQAIRQELFDSLGIMLEEVEDAPTGEKWNNWKFDKL